jgi:hypothetical protein
LEYGITSNFDPHSTNYSQGKVGHKVEREYKCLEKGYACVVSRIELLNGYPVQFTMDPVRPIVRQGEEQKPPRQ